MKIAVDKGRATRPGLEVGICGEHGGDPESIAKVERIGLDYVSCSPFRVPVARLAAAQATLARRARGTRQVATRVPGFSGALRCGSGASGQSRYQWGIASRGGRPHRCRMVSEASDHYRVLQVDPAADLEVIQAAYRVLARRYHPDLSGDDER